MALMLLPSVRLAGLQPQMVVAVHVVEIICDQLGVDCVITCGAEGQHSTASLHYAGAALDFRTRDLTADQQKTLVSLAKERLGPDFDVVLESTHLHCEWQPKWRGPTQTEVA